MKRKTKGVRNLTILFAFLAGTQIMAASAAEREPFRIGDLSIRPGETGEGFLTVPQKEGTGTLIPVTVFHGVGEGKVLSLVAGVHGYEYPPILALYRLKSRINPRKLSGTLILVHIANLPSFQRRTIYYNPSDWKNLNRVFPGDAQGTLSQRIAHVLAREVIRRSDVLIDMHCGDGNEALIPYTYWMISGTTSLDEESKKIALAFGIPHIIIDKSRTKDPADSKYFGNTAILEGKPAVTTEYGCLGMTDEEAVSANVEGCLGVMRHLEMIEGAPEYVSDPVWIDDYQVVYSDYDGLFYPRAQKGHYVVKGQRIGHITDYLGTVKAELRAPFGGILLYIIGTPPIGKGEPLFEVGRLKE